MMAICLTPQNCTQQIADSLTASVAHAIQDSAGQMVTTLFAWWTTTPSINLNTPLIHDAQSYVTAWIAVPVAVLAALAAVSWGVLGGGHTWVTDIARGLLVFGVVAAGSIPLVVALQAWSTSLARGLLGAASTRGVGTEFVHLLNPTSVTSLIVAFWAFVVLIVASIQYVMMLFRDGAVVILTAVLPLAAAGQFNRASAIWPPRVAGWLLAFIFMKPAAALIYFIGFALIGDGDGLQSLATGVCVMIAAIFALPAMLRLVSFVADAAPLGSGALGGATMAAGMAASAAQAASRIGGGGNGPAAAAPEGAALPEGAASPEGAAVAAGAAAGPAGAAVAGAAQAVQATETTVARSVDAGVDGDAS